MNILKWININTKKLNGKTVAVSGATGGIGNVLCRYLAFLGADLILLDRNSQKSNALKEKLEKEFEGIKVNLVRIDLADITLVKEAINNLKNMPIDVLILNAGAYSIPRYKCNTGFDNVFQINFVSPYYLVKELLPDLRKREGRVVAVSSIAHNYSKIDVKDIDFSTRKQSSLLYGNAKRFLTFSLFELFKNKNGLAVVHPGITFTNITAHYPKIIFAIIKYPMKIIFMKPRKAALSILKGVFEDTYKNEWIGPKIFNIWGKPLKQRLKTCTDEERKMIFKTAEEIYFKLKSLKIY